MWNVNYRRYHIACCYQDPCTTGSESQGGSRKRPPDGLETHTREYFIVGTYEE